MRSKPNSTLTIDGRASDFYHLERGWTVNQQKSEIVKLWIWTQN